MSWFLSRGKIQLCSIACECLIFPSSFVEETVLYPWCSLGAFVQDHFTLFVWVYFWNIYSVSLVYVCIKPVYHTVLITVDLYCFEIKKCDISSFVLLFQNCFAYLGSFEIPYEIWVFFSPLFLQKVSFVLDRDFIESVDIQMV